MSSSATTPKAGDLYFTKSDITVFDYEAGKDVNLTVDPVTIVLASNGKDKEFGITLYRCYVVTPTKEGAAVRDQDVDLGNGWVLHKWLGYPVSLDQIDLERKLGQVDIKYCQAANDYFYKENKMTRYGKQERELMKKAMTVCYMADAALDKAEWEADHSED